jgi:iron transport multicopper oxidase
VHDPDSPYKDQYDEEVVITLADWYHQLPSTLLKKFISYANPTGAEPVPDAALMNDTQGLKIKMEPGKTYMFRVVNMAAFAAQYFWIEGHTMRVVEVDGVYTEPMDAEMLYFTAAQRYSFLITARNDTKANFAISGSMDQVLYFLRPPSHLLTNSRTCLTLFLTRSTPTSPAGLRMMIRQSFLRRQCLTSSIPLMISLSFLSMA